jgi:hypothetical protein
VEKKARDLIGFTTLLWLCRLPCGDGRAGAAPDGNLFWTGGTKRTGRQAATATLDGSRDGETAPDANVLGGVRKRSRHGRQFSFGYGLFGLDEK